MGIKSYFELVIHWLLTSGLRVLLIVVLTLVALRVARFPSTRIFKLSKKEKDLAFSKDILEPIEILGLDQFADSAIIIKARTKTKPIRQWAVGREFNRRLKKKFDEKDIEIPFPHLTLSPNLQPFPRRLPMQRHLKMCRSWTQPSVF
jgi:hypothetical protein